MFRRILHAHQDFHVASELKQLNVAVVLEKDENVLERDENDVRMNKSHHFLRPMINTTTTSFHPTACSHVFVER